MTVPAIPNRFTYTKLFTSFQIIPTPQVRAILDATTLTAWRTAAASAAAVRCLLCAPSPNIHTSDINIAVIGAGVQAASHIRLLCAPGCLPGRRVARIAVCARSPSSSAALVDSLRSVPPFSASPESAAAGQGAPALTIAATAAAACDGADLIVCCTSSAAPILHADDLCAARGLVIERGASHDNAPCRRRVLIVAVGAWRPSERELASSVVDAAAAFCVDSRAAAAAESGDALLSTRGAQRIDAELGAVIPRAQRFWAQHEEQAAAARSLSSAHDNASTGLDAPAQSTGVVPLSALGLAGSGANGTEWVVFKSLGQAFEDLAAAALVCDALHVK